MTSPTQITAMSNEDLYHTVPMLDGSNYTSWAQAITAALRSKGVWQIARGHELCPEDLPANANADARAEREKEIAAWDNKDDQALGLMQFKNAEDVASPYW